MSFTPNLSQLRSLVLRSILVVGVCVGGLIWIQSYGDPEFKAAVDGAAPPYVQLTFEADEGGHYHAELYDAATGVWSPVPDSTQFYEAGKRTAFIELGDPPPKVALLRMKKVDKQIRPTIFPAVATQCPASTPAATTCPAVATFCTPVATNCPGKSTQCAGVATACPVNVTNCPAKPTTCVARPTQCPARATACRELARSMPTDTTVPTPAVAAAASAASGWSSIST